jgi:hypothetical protein
MFAQLMRRLRRRGDVHAAVSVNSGRDGQVTATASSTTVDPEEAERQDADVLPERQAMTVLQPPHIVGPPIAALPGEGQFEPLPPEQD